MIKNNKNSLLLLTMQGVLGEKFAKEFEETMVKDIFEKERIEKVAVMSDSNRYLGFGYWVRCDIKNPENESIQHRFKHFWYKGHLKENMDYQKEYKSYLELCKKESTIVFDCNPDSMKQNAPVGTFVMKTSKYLKEKQKEFNSELVKTGKLKKYLFDQKFIGELRDDEDEIFEDNEILVNKIAKKLGKEIAKIVKDASTTKSFKIKGIGFIPNETVKRKSEYEDKKYYDFGFDVYYEFETLKNGHHRKDFGIEKSYHNSGDVLFDSKNIREQKEFENFNKLAKEKKCAYFKTLDNFRIVEWELDANDFKKEYENRTKILNNLIEKQEELFLEKKQLKDLERER